MYPGAHASRNSDKPAVVLDGMMVAVFGPAYGIPDQEFGESVLAVVPPASGVEAGPEVAARLLAHVRSRLADDKVPRRVDFVESLPRTATGKLVKGRLKQRYANTAT